MSKDMDTMIDAEIERISKRSPFKGKPRDPERIERMLDLLREIWTAQPDTRLTQLIVNAAPRGPEPVPHLFHLEDDRLERLLRERYLPEAEDAPAGPTP